jgi:hypothetical protein
MRISTREILLRTRRSRERRRRARSRKLTLKRVAMLICRMRKKLREETLHHLTRVGRVTPQMRTMMTAMILRK